MQQYTMIDIVYCPPWPAPVFHVRLHADTCARVGELLEQSGLWQQHPETRTFTVGIFSQTVPWDTHVKSGDRIEVYRPLNHDPKDQRRQRAQAQK